MPNRFTKAKERYLTANPAYDPALMEALAIAERTSKGECGCMLLPCPYHRRHGVGRPDDDEGAASTIPGNTGRSIDRFWIDEYYKFVQIDSATTSKKKKWWQLWR